MIHELLIGTNPKARPVLTWNMMIGGPNQSHKVNFKELPAEGKSFIKIFLASFVNTFSKDFRKIFSKDFKRSLLVSRRTVFSAALVTREGGT